MSPKMKAIVKTATRFVNSADFVTGIISSTKAGFGGSGYSVELFEDGHWRVQWDNQFGNMYHSPGMIVRLPQCSDEDIACENPDCLAAGECTCGWDWELEVRADDYIEEFMADVLA